MKLQHIAVRLVASVLTGKSDCAIVNTIIISVAAKAAVHILVLIILSGARLTDSECLTQITSAKRFDRYFQVRNDVF